MSPARQLPLAFEPRPALGGEDFLVAPCNAAAVDWLDRWPDWPAPALVIAGEPGAGKTHLAQVFLAMTGGRRLPLDVLDDTTAADDAPALVIDDADAVAGDRAREEALFHLYNRLVGTGRRLLLTARTPPARWGIGLPDLASRLKGAPLAEIGRPDDALIQALLVKLFADRQLRVPAEVVQYAASRMERSFAAARSLVEAVDREGLARRRAVTIPLVREVLERGATPPEDR